MILSCGHAEKASEIRLCPHFVGQEDVSFWRVLRGDAMRYDCCCKLCSEAFERGEALDWVEVCTACAQKIDGEVWEMCGWLGAPSIEESLVPFDDTLQTVTFADAMRAATALYPLDFGRVLGLCQRQIGIFENDSFVPFAPVEMPIDCDYNWANHHLTPRFHLSPERTLCGFGQ